MSDLFTERPPVSSRARLHAQVLPWGNVLYGVVTLLDKMINPSNASAVSKSDSVDLDQLLPSDDPQLTHIRRLVDQLHAAPAGASDKHLRTMAQMEMRLFGIPDTKIQQILAL